MIEGVDKIDAFRRNPDFDELIQLQKQTGSISKNALKPAVFLGRNEFCLRIPLGKRSCFPNHSAIQKSICLQFAAFFYLERRKFINSLFLCCLKKPYRYSTLRLLWPRLRLHRSYWDLYSPCHCILSCFSIFRRYR